MNKWFLIFFLVVIDQFSKTLVLNYNYQASFNQGIAFGLLVSQWWLAINLIVVLLVLIILRKFYYPQALIVSGGIANILDRFLRGGVVDFINISLIFRLINLNFVFPDFNLADIMICLGVIWLIFDLFYQEFKVNINKKH